MTQDCDTKEPKLSLPRLSLASTATGTSVHVQNSCASQNSDSLIPDSRDLEADRASSTNGQFTARTEYATSGCCGSQQGLSRVLADASVRSLGSWASLRSQRTFYTAEEPHPSIRKKIAETLDYYLLYRITTLRSWFSGADGCDMSFCEAEGLLQGICRKSFARRIDLEIRMMHTLPRFCWFFVAFSIFLSIQWIEYHPENFSETHKSLRSHFKLDSDFYDIDRVPHLVSYLGDFATAARTFNALHPYYWCPENDATPLSPEIPERMKCKTRGKFSFDTFFNGCSADELEDGGCGVCGAESTACSACAAGPSSKVKGCGTKFCSANATRCSGNSTCGTNSISSAAQHTICGGCSGNVSSSLTYCSANTCSGHSDVKCSTHSGSNYSNSSGAHGRQLMSKNIGRNTPSTHSIKLLLPFHVPLIPEIQRSTMPKQDYVVDQGIFGVAVNGVLIVGAHHREGRKAQITWHFDDCGGHGDTDGWYHYHFPPSCLIASGSGTGPSLATWWSQEAPETYWPQRSAPSPLLGHALDGHPIYGPYGLDGKLVSAADLDRCHGKFVLGPNGTQVYRYYWLVEAPFLPPCFSDVPERFDWNVPAGAPCPNDGTNSYNEKQLDPSVSDDIHSRWEVKSNSCPNHVYFQNSVFAQRVDPSLQEPLMGHRQLTCSASTCSASSQSSCGSSNNESKPDAIDIFNPCAAAFGESKPPPPESYRRFRAFTMITASVMPALLWQTRFEPTECKSTFARGFNNQSTNPDYNAPLDAPRRDPIIRCRSTDLSTAPHLGYSAIGEDAPRYSVFLSESIMRPIKDYDWIDDLTHEVTLALLLYTPGREDLTLLRLRFKVQPSGRIKPSFVLTTHSSFRDREDFGFWLALNIVFLVVALWRVIMSVRDLWKESWLDEKKSVRRFDAFFAIVFFVFSASSLIRRLFVCSLLEDVTPLIESFYGVGDITDAAQVDQTLLKYFRVLTRIMDRVNAEEVLKMVAYLIVIVSIIRLIGYMSVHPRIAVLSQTLTSASDNIFHFSLVFCFICGLLAWLACWSFGPDKDLFCTLQYALLTQLKMVMGEFPFDDPWKETVLERMWYVCYAVLVFFLAVNIFLAIIVEAFVLVKKRLAEEVLVERNIGVDFVCLVRYWLLGQSMNWPSRLSVARHLQTTRHFQGAVNSGELRKSKFLKSHFKSRLEAQQYLDFYYSVLGENILSKQGQEYVKLQHQQKETRKCLVVLFNVSQVQMDPSAQRIQKAWHRYRKRKMGMPCDGRRSAAEAVASWTSEHTLMATRSQNLTSEPQQLPSSRESRLIPENSSENVTKAASLHSLPSLLQTAIVNQKSTGSFSSIGDEIMADV